MEEVKKYTPNRYILSFHARRKNYRRKIFKRCKTYQEAYDTWLQHYNGSYDFEIYTYNWKLVKKLTLEDLKNERQV